MIRKLQSTFRCRAIALAAIISFTLVAVSSCTKSSSGGSDAVQFNGTWTGTSSCNSGTGSLTFTGSGNTVTTAGSIGSGSCNKSITYTGTASGNTFTFPATNYTDNCGVSYTSGGAGTLSGGTLTFTLNVSGGATGSCTFTGAK